MRKTAVRLRIFHAVQDGEVLARVPAPCSPFSISKQVDMHEQHPVGRTFPGLFAPFVVSCGWLQKPPPPEMKKLLRIQEP